MLSQGEVKLGPATTWPGLVVIITAVTAWVELSSVQGPPPDTAVIVIKPAAASGGTRFSCHGLAPHRVGRIGTVY